MLSLFGKKKEKTILLIDIASGSVGVALAEVKKNKNISFSGTRIVARSREAIPTGTDTNLAPIIIGLCKKIITSDILVSHTRLSIAPPWIQSHIQDIHVPHDKQFVITKSFLASIATEEEKKYAQTLEEGEWCAVEQNNLETKVNGYKVSSVIGVTTKDFSLLLQLSFAEKKIGSAIQESVTAITHTSTEHVQIHSAAFISTTVLARLPDSADFLIVDVMRECTEISVVRDGVLRKSHSFPSGNNFIIRQLTKNLEVSEEIALSTLHLFLKKMTDPFLTEKVTGILENIEKEWAIYFEDAAAALDPLFALPEKVYMVTHSAFAPVYEEFLTLSKTDATAAFRKNIHIVRVSQETLGTLGLIDTSSQPFDPHLGLSAVFYLQFIKSDIQ